MNFDRYVPERVRSNYTLKMAAVIALVAFVTVASGVILFANATGEMTTASDDRFAEHATDRGTVLELWVHTNRGVATDLAVEAEDADLSTLEGEMEAAVATHPNRIDAIQYLGRDGAVRTRVGDGSETSYADVSMPSPGSSAVVPTPDENGVAFLAAASDGVVVVETNGTYLRSALDGERATTAAVYDGEVLVGSTRPDRDAAALDALEPGERTSVTVNETDYAIRGTALDGTEWATVTHAPTGDLYTDRETAVAAATALLYLIVLNLALVGILIGGNLSLSLRQLTDRARSLGEGNLDVELTSERTDEVGDLYREFDSMRLSLQDSLSEARRAQKEAEAAQAEAERAREDAEQSRRETERLNDRLEAEAQRYGDVMEACADGDLTRRIDPEIDSEAMVAIAEAFNGMIADLEATIASVDDFAADVRAASDDVEAIAGAVRAATAEVDETVAEISDGAAEQTESVRTVADEVDGLSASIEEVAATTDEVASESDRVAELGQDGRDTAQATVEEMEAIERTTASLVDSIEALDEGVDRIDDVVALIDDIAEQTNILALNASIEAARADADTGGEGFGVVAAEVKELATETQDAVAEIEAVVEEIKARTAESTTELQSAEEQIADGIESVEELADAMEAICDGVEAVDGGLQDINRTTDDQASSAQEIVSMVERVSEIAEQTSQRSDSVAAASSDAADSVADVASEAGDLADRAQSLEDALAAFRVNVEDGPEGDNAD